MTHYPNELSRLRRIRSWSQKQLGLLLNVRSIRAISNFENGRRLPQLKVALTMEIVLGAKLSEIYPEYYRTLGLQAVEREDRLPDRFSRHIRGRVLERT